MAKRGDMPVKNNDTLTVEAYAKVNLSLNITAGGVLHTLDSIMATVNISDRIVIETAAADSVCYVNAEIGAGDTVLKALKLVGGRPCYRIAVEKRIPIGAGLGGSSADAAAVLKALKARAKGIKAGSDVPFMIRGGVARVRGKGGWVKSLLAPVLHMVLLLSGPVDTAAAYRSFDSLYPRKSYAPADTGRLAAALAAGDLKTAGQEMKNALTAASCLHNPRIAVNLQRLQEFSPYGAVMTGSGGGVIALFDEERAKQVAAKLGGIYLKTINI